MSTCYLKCNFITVTLKTVRIFDDVISRQNLKKGEIIKVNEYYLFIFVIKMDYTQDSDGLIEYFLSVIQIGLQGQFTDDMTT